MIQNALMKGENRAKKIFVRMLIGLLGFTLSLSIIYFLMDLASPAVLNLLAAICSPIGIWLTYRGFFLTSKILMHLMVLFVVLGCCAVYGKDSMILSFMVPLVQSALTIFGRREWPFTTGYLLIILISVPVMIISGFRIYPVSLDGTALESVQLINILGAIGFSVVQITYASWVNVQFREALEMRNEESENTNQLLKSALSTRDQLFNMLAHDLRSPFVALESGLIMLEDLEIPEDKKWIVKEIRDNARNTLGLLDNTLDWARSQTNNIRFEPDDLLVQDLLNKVQHNFSMHLRSKGISIHIENQSGIRVFADANMLLSIIQNLVSNAIKFTGKDGNIWISVMGLLEGTEFRIRDSGTGMSQEEIGQILSGGTFSRPGTAREKGHGVGLLLVREFLAKHRAALSLKSAPGMGSEFGFIIPSRSRIS